MLPPKSCKIRENIKLKDICLTGKGLDFFFIFQASFQPFIVWINEPFFMSIPFAQNNINVYYKNIFLKSTTYYLSIINCFLTY